MSKRQLTFHELEAIALFDKDVKRNGLESALNWIHSHEYKHWKVIREHVEENAKKYGLGKL